MSALPEGLVLHEAIPASDEYLALRKLAGLSAFSEEGAAIGLPNSWFAVCVRDIATYEQPEGERQLLGALLDDAARAALTGDDAVKIARRNVRASLVYSGAPGVLVVDQLMSRL